MRVKLGKRPAPKSFFFYLLHAESGFPSSLATLPRQDRHYAALKSDSAVSRFPSLNHQLRLFYVAPRNTSLEYLYTRSW